MDREDYWQKALDLVSDGPMYGNSARFAYLAFRAGCGNECMTKGVFRPGGQQTNGGCVCASRLRDLLNRVAKDAAWRAKNEPR